VRTGGRKKSDKRLELRDGGEVHIQIKYGTKGTFSIREGKKNGSGGKKERRRRSQKVAISSRIGEGAENRSANGGKKQSIRRKLPTAEVRVPKAKGEVKRKPKSLPINLDGESRCAKIGGNNFEKKRKNGRLVRSSGRKSTSEEKGIKLRKKGVENAQ